MPLEASNPSLPLEERYFYWLYNKVCSIREKNPEENFLGMLEVMYGVPFEWYVPNDDNRAEDGIDLRYEYLDEESSGTETFLSSDCSMLEMFIGMARRISFELGLATDICFWVLMENLNLTGKQFSDAFFSDAEANIVHDAMITINSRTYDYDGTGGLFPIFDPREDQRKVELWYQMSAFLTERYELY